MATYKTTFEACLSAGQIPKFIDPASYPRTFVNAFNGYLMDVCNLLWRSRAFNTSDTNARGCLLAPEVATALKTYTDALTPSQPLVGVFGLGYHPAIAAMAAVTWTDMEEADLQRQREHLIADEGMEVDHDDVAEVRLTGPASLRSLQALASDGGAHITWSEYRLGVLAWQEQRGVGGIARLMRNTMKLLMDKKIRESTGRGDGGTPGGGTPVQVQ